MRKNDTPTRSPFEQMQFHDGLRSPVRAARPTARPDLRPDEARVVADLLSRPIDFIDSPTFHEREAQIRIYEKSIAKPDISWYQPLMDRLTRSPNQAVSSGQIKRLSSKQERVLFHQFNYAKFRISKIQEELGMEADPSGAPGQGQPASIEPTGAQIREMLRWHRKVEDLRTQIAESNVGLVIAMARRTRIRDLEFADLVSEGNMALLRSAEKFNADYGFKFSTYACQSILKAFSRLGVKASRHRERFPVEFEPELEVARPFDERRELLDQDCAEEVASIVKENRCGLTDVEMSIIRHRFGISDDAPQGRASASLDRSLTLGQVGQIVGVGKERVRQIQVKALAKIRRELESRFLYREEPEDQSPITN